jgi:hypothetical protein
LWPGAVIGKIPGKMSNVAHLVSGADRLFDERFQPGTSDSASLFAAPQLLARREGHVVHMPWE